ncbi:MAG: hypothetical protein JSV16_10115, partial [Candidatus Hydrogenedentota bacterium]
ETPSKRDMFWEMGKQTAIRRGKWKLVLGGKLVEGAPVDDAVHLSDLNEDMGEKINLQSQQTGLVADLRTAALNWRAGIEERWEKEFSRIMQGTVTFSSQQHTAADADKPRR